ncbi:DUF4123 domain-containing protein [Pseudomonas sp. SWRI92]|uniref:DUF4123 domain-containing protein n=1 Tax=Pseudomonas sp. SWRI92 TaxID=2745499 RepID=UPI001645A1AE|nr:DUF4123 domain-containing protein [Pseudomonas sp. SWRI92]MBC3373012.1 DUF4123 domain-containing protein [Pseudomonas sp. SWRI92]
MSDSLPQQWLFEQQRLGHALCVVLDSENEQPMRQALLKNSQFDCYLSVYSQTPLADLSEVGPFVFTFDNPHDKNINELFGRPATHWGWLASLPKGHLPKLVEHWRERLIIGQRPDQAVYRFQDARVLARALKHLPVEMHAAYLGPAASVCYWQGARWERVDNPGPGIHPVPAAPLWLQVPAPEQQAREIRRVNARRFLLAEHLDAYVKLAEHQDPDAWLRATLDQAEAWNWLAPEQLAFLLVKSLQVPAQTLTPQWQVCAGESPEEHFERVRLMADFWQGNAPL